MHTILFSMALAYASGLCPDSGSKALLRLKTDAGPTLLVCGQQQKEWVPNMTVYAVFGERRERLLDGDAAFKVYAYGKDGPSIWVDEALRDGRVLLRWQVGCANANACSAREAHCRWRKGRSRIAKLPSGEATPEEWTQTFSAALDGDDNAKAAFKVKNAGLAERSEAFSTFRADVQRLEALGCL